MLSSLHYHHLDRGLRSPYRAEVALGHNQGIVLPVILKMFALGPHTADLLNERD